MQIQIFKGGSFGNGSLYAVSHSKGRMQDSLTVVEEDSEAVAGLERGNPNKKEKRKELHWKIMRAGEFYHHLTFLSESTLNR